MPLRLSAAKTAVPLSSEIGRSAEQPPISTATLPNSFILTHDLDLSYQSDPMHSEHRPPHPPPPSPLPASPPPAEGPLPPPKPPPRHPPAPPQGAGHPRHKFGPCI